MKLRATILFLALFIGVALSNPLKTKVDLTKEDATLPDLTKLRSSQRQALTCGRRCNFRFCDGESDLIVGATDVAASSAICKDGMGTNTTGIVGQTGEPRVQRMPGMRPVPISRYSPPGLNQRFSRSFFKTFDIPGTQTSGVGQEIAQGNQHKFIDGLCVLLPIRTYQILDADGRLANRMRTNFPRDCIAFSTNVPRVLIELMWDTADDLDLHVVEPDGDRVNFMNRRTEAGELIVDDNVFVCGTPNETGLERTIYAADGPVEMGEYRVFGRHFNNCNDGSTQWRIRIFIDGKLTETVFGTSNQDNDTVIRGSRVRFTL